MPAGMGLDGKMIPRRVKRMFDQRGERRGDGHGVMTHMRWRDRTIEVRLANLSASGAMVVCDEMPHIGELVVLDLPDRGAWPGEAKWIKDGCVGIHFAAPLD